MAGAPLDRIPLHAAILPVLGMAAWLLVGKVGLRSMVDKTLEPLHVALLAERARRFEGGKRPEANGDVS